MDALTDRSIFRRVTELTVFGAVKLVRLPKLVDKPDNLVRMLDQVGNFVVITTSGGFCISAPSSMRRHIIVLVASRSFGHGSHGRLTISASKTTQAQLLNEPVRENLDPAAHERHLRPTHRHPHRLKTDSRDRLDVLLLGTSPL